jgi:hypothetical protein
MTMTDKNDKKWKTSTKVGAAAIGSAAIAAALLYANKRKKDKAAPKPSKDAPETD